MNTKLETISKNLKANGFSPKQLSVEPIIIIHDEGYEWVIKESQIERYDWKKGFWERKVETFATIAEFNSKFEAMMVER